MANLESCYFCGAADDIDRYAVVPSRFDPTEDEQRSVALCPTCFEKLRTVIDPLVSRLDGAGPASTPGPSGADGTTDASGRSRSPADADATDRERARDGANLDEPGRDAPGARAPDAGPVDGTDEDAGRPRPGVSEERRAARDTLRMGQGKPPGYGKVMRLMENRTFPVRRGTIAEIANDAYGIDPGLVDDIVATAVEDGRLAVDDEDPDVLYRGQS